MCVHVCVLQGTGDVVVNLESYLLILYRLGFSITCLLAFATKYSHLEIVLQM